MFDTILVPLDGSKRAEAILPHVEELARMGQATVIFLQVVEPITVIDPYAPYVHVELAEQLVKEAQEYLAGGCLEAALLHSWTAAVQVMCAADTHHAQSSWHLALSCGAPLVSPS